MVDITLISAACCGPDVVPRVVKRLLEKGSNPNQYNEEGEGVVLLELLLRNMMPSGEWHLQENASRYRQVIYMLVDHGALMGYVPHDYLGSMRVWVKTRELKKVDRRMIRYLLKKWYQEMAAEDESSTDESSDDEAGEDEAIGE